MKATKSNKHNALVRAETQTHGGDPQVDEESKILKRGKMVVAGSGDKSYAS
ncbi:hypothetical protein ANAEL_04449 [Anaerolineales bacterium]|nr:hypothetical protein ANAEL_04449 [Anaerolineales bacterium]